MRDKLHTLLVAQNTKEKYEDDNGYDYLPDVFYPLGEDKYEWSTILSEEQIEAIKSFRDKKYFTQEEAHEVIEFLIERCYQLGAIKNY